MNITAKELSGMHVGKRIVIHHPSGRIWQQGEIKTFLINPDHVYVELVNGIHTLGLNPDTPITIQEGQLIGQSGNTGAFAREPIQETIRKKIERNTQEGQ